MSRQSRWVLGCVAMGSVLLGSMTVNAAVVGRAVGPAVADDLNVTNFAFGGDFTTEDTDANSGGTLPVGSDARTLAFTSAGDTFGIEDRGDGPAFALMDDSAFVFPGDTQGVIEDQDFDNFFGVTDTINNDNANALTAAWTFDVSGASGGLTVSIDFAAMGDFEDGGADLFDFDVALDGGAFSNIFVSSVDELATQTYNMEDGAQVMLDDPLLMNGTLLNDQFQTLVANVPGTGSSLSVRLTAQTNGGAEAFLFRNIVIEDGAAAGVGNDYNGDGTVNAADYTLWRDLLGENTALANETATPGSVTQEDYDAWVASFGNSGTGVGTAVIPEPSTLLLGCLIAFSGTMLRRRR